MEWICGFLFYLFAAFGVAMLAWHLVLHMYQKAWQEAELPVSVKIKELTEGCFPVKAHPGDSGYDLYAAKDMDIYSGETKIIPLGFAVEMPKGMELQIRPRSGNSLRGTLMSPNAVGTVDSGYRGEVGFIVNNFGERPVKIKKGMRICQGVFQRVPDVVLLTAKELSPSQRGDKGFGSTGV